MARRRFEPKSRCGGCGERVAEGRLQEAYRTSEGGVTRFRDHPVPGSTLALLCPACYREWDVEADGLPGRT